jgi:hypothetical protein
VARQLVEHRGKAERHLRVAEPAVLVLSGLVPQPRRCPVMTSCSARSAAHRARCWSYDDSLPLPSTAIWARGLTSRCAATDSEYAPAGR